MYLGVLALIVGQAILFRSRSLAWFAVWVALGFHAFVFLYEERTLRNKYGESYDVFCDHVPRWIPRLSPWNGGTSPALGSRKPLAR